MSKNNHSQHAHDRHQQQTGVLGKTALFTRDRLEQMGGLIDRAHRNFNSVSNFQAADLNTDSDNDNLFRQQTLKSSSQLIGSRFATYGKYIKKVVPDKMFNQAVDNAFEQVAKLAERWSETDLPSDRRFADMRQADEQQRQALAHEIANQNRALATMGGFTGLAGLPGLFADTLWLLLVSLRIVYQTATIYDQPLTGKQGIKMAYRVVQAADLSKMQDKQAILAALGISKQLLDRADNSGLHNELKNLGIKNANVDYYAKHLDQLANRFHVNIDNVNLKWVTRALPVFAVGVGMHYNSRLIEQVIGVAQATFGSDPKMANHLLEDNSKQGALPKSFDKDKYDQQHNEDQSSGTDKGTKHNADQSNNAATSLHQSGTHQDEHGNIYEDSAKQTVKKEASSPYDNQHDTTTTDKQESFMNQSTDHKAAFSADKDTNTGSETQDQNSKTTSSDQNNADMDSNTSQNPSDQNDPTHTDASYPQKDDFGQTDVKHSNKNSNAGNQSNK